jgi:NAD-dependent SIR2 family protein deacetylase
MSKKIPLEVVAKICDQIINCKALIITAGPGMSKDSGIPDLRSSRVFRKEYSEFLSAGFTQAHAFDPGYLEYYPKKIWYFYGHRYNLFRNTTYHPGYTMLKEICKKFVGGNFFVVTSNTDDHFKKAGSNKSLLLRFRGA